jgi:sterol 3beta-glucosyltransferase
LYGYSPLIVPRPADWPDDTRVTGYWFPQDEAWRPPESLVNFLDAGPPPVFVGFGSMPVTDPRPTTKMVVEATRAGRHRIIIQAGWAGLGQSALPAHIYRLEYAPYSWLFPRMSAVIHHGGSGTTAAGLRAGRPGLVASFTFDQGFWGRRLAALGVGLPPIPFRRLTTSRLAEALDQLVTDENVNARATELGRKVHAEDGIGTAVRLIEAFLDRPAPV